MSGDHKYISVLFPLYLHQLFASFCLSIIVSVRLSTSRCVSSLNRRPIWLVTRGHRFVGVYCV